jgi:hypothetical protein
MHRTDLSIILYHIKRIVSEQWFFFLQINRIGDGEPSQRQSESAENAVP